MQENININNKIIGPGAPTFVIAEISGNHGGEIKNAIKLIDEAKSIGADAVKLQTYTADTITLNSEKEDFIIPAGNAWEDSKTLYSLYTDAYTPWEWHERLFNHAKKIDIEIFSSPFDNTAVDFLESLNVPMYKIASPEIFDVQLLKKVASTGKPVILSTGLARLDDIELAIETLKNNGCVDIVLLKCSTSYPLPYEEVNLNTMVDFKEKFDVIVGLSDHTIGIAIPLAAVSMGANVIEKHIVFENEETVDSFFSLKTNEFKLMVQEIRNIEKSFGEVNYELSKRVKKNDWAKRSLYFHKNVKKGDKIKGCYKSVRPGYGIHPKYFDEISSYVANKDIEIGDRVEWDVISKINE